MNFTTKDLQTILYSLEGYIQANDDTELVEELEDICYRIDKKLEEKYKELDEINELKSLLKEEEYDNNERESKFIDINNTGGKY